MIAERHIYRLCKFLIIHDSRKISLIIYFLSMLVAFTLTDFFEVAIFSPRIFWKKTSLTQHEKCWQI